MEAEGQAPEKKHLSDEETMMIMGRCKQIMDLAVAASDEIWKVVMDKERCSDCRADASGTSAALGVVAMVAQKLVERYQVRSRIKGFGGLLGSDEN